MNSKVINSDQGIFFRWFATTHYGFYISFILSICSHVVLGEGAHPAREFHQFVVKNDIQHIKRKPFEVMYLHNAKGMQAHFLDELWLLHLNRSSDGGSRINSKCCRIPFYLPEAASASRVQFYPDVLAPKVAYTSVTGRNIMSEGGEVGSGCLDYVATNLPQDIPDNNAAGLISLISVPSGGIIESVSIKDLRGNHSWVGDLKFTLISPTGTMVVVIENRCSNMDDFSIGLSDAASDIITCPINDIVVEKPDNPLSAFIGESPLGDWKLVVVDYAAEDTGALDGWALHICIQGGGSGDCPSMTTVDDTPIANGIYQAGTQLTSMGSIQPASDVLFRAGDNVDLKPYFSVANGVNFEVRIEGCQ